jgi:hypothetical protein
MHIIIYIENKSLELVCENNDVLVNCPVLVVDLFYMFTTALSLWGVVIYTNTEVCLKINLFTSINRNL